MEMEKQKVVRLFYKQSNLLPQNFHTRGLKQFLDRFSKSCRIFHQRSWTIFRRLTRESSALGTVSPWLILREGLLSSWPRENPNYPVDDRRIELAATVATGKSVD